MRNDTLFGLIGSVFGLCAALYIILSADTPAMELSGVQVALFSALGFGGAGFVKNEPSFAGWMMIMSASFLVITAPMNGSIAIPLSYLPAVIFFAGAGILALTSVPREKAADIEEPPS
jgi:hypothetical protein